MGCGLVIELAEGSVQWRAGYWVGWRECSVADWLLSWLKGVFSEAADISFQINHGNFWLAKELLRFLKGTLLCGVSSSSNSRCSRSGSNTGITLPSATARRISPNTIALAACNQWNVLSYFLQFNLFPRTLFPKLWFVYHCWYPKNRLSVCDLNKISRYQKE